jgi:predicted nucleotidyltransferase
MGLSTEDSDHDIMEVHLEPREAITGFAPFSAKHTSTAGMHKRSTAEDTDTVRYGLRHWAELAARGNPTAMTPLFVPPRLYTTPVTRLGALIMSKGHLFVSKEAGRRYRGYSLGQFKAMEGLRNKKTNRPELVHKHGYDTKFAYHMVRTAMQGFELMNSGWVNLPIPTDMARDLRAIRNGEVSRERVLEYWRSIDADLEQAIERTTLPDQAQYDKIYDLLHEVYTEGWACTTS